MNVNPSPARPGIIAAYALSIGRAWPLFALAITCVFLVPKTPLRVLGPLTVALVAGMILRRAPVVRSIPVDSVVLLSRLVLRVGVVLTAVRLDGVLLVHAGPGPLIVAVVSILAGFTAFAGLLRVVKVDPKLGALLAIGTSVCGAAAIVAARPVVHPSDEESHVSIAIVSVLGAIASVALIGALSLGWVSLGVYGLFAGGSLHEVAHVMAAATAAPSVIDVATVTKLARVALLPVALLLIPWVAPRHGLAFQKTRFQVPGLVIGFFAVSIIATVLEHTTAGSAQAFAAWHATSRAIVLLATLLMGAAMGAIGVLVDWKALRRAGAPALIVSVVGSIILGGVVLITASHWGYAPTVGATATSKGASR
jgi:uncharacterized integral membrane protein (TIGR00698 family)